MKHLTTIFSAIAAAAAVVSCSEKQEYDLSWLDQFNVNLPEELDRFNTEYRLEMTNDISDITYHYDGDASLGTSYTTATVEQAVETAGFLENEVFPYFPEGFIARYMPATIFVADSVRYEYIHEVYDYTDRMVHTTERLYRSLYGDIGQRQLTLAASRLSDGTDRETLKFEWTSLLIERMMYNTGTWSVPSQFISTANELFRNYYMPYMSYYQETLSSGATNFAMPGSPDPKAFSIWYYCGSIRCVRYGYDNRCIYTAGFTGASSGGEGAEQTSYTYLKPTSRQDFADYMAYLLVYGEDGWEEFLQGIDGLSETDTDGDGNVTATYTCSRSVFETRLQYVENYMESVFGWDISEKTNQ